MGKRQQDQQEGGNLRHRHEPYALSQVASAGPQMATLFLTGDGTSGAESAPRTIPTSVILLQLDAWDAQAAQVERYCGADCARTMKEMSREMRARITGAACRWVNTSDAARIRGVSEETIRRYCRTGSADFRFTQEDGKYLIWLQDLKVAA